MKFDFLIAGGGIVGISLARELAMRAKSSIGVIEKEPDIAMHASGRNSGVLHAGFYYSADSLKAKFCRQGNMEMRSFCKENGLKLNECGKVVVAKNKEDLKGLEELERRGNENGVNLSMLGETELKNVEPHAVTCGKALYSPDTAVVDPVEVCRALKNDAEKKGVQFMTNTALMELENQNTVKTTRGKISFGHFINCAGAHADNVAHMFSAGMQYKMLPFKGCYYELRGEKSAHIRSNIYPVPNLHFPFLGVHFTKTVQGNVLIGPTATPVFSRENYEGIKDIRVSEFSSIFFTEAKLFAQNKNNFRNLALSEMKQYLKSNIIREALQMVHGLTANNIVKSSHSGIRAQLFNKKLGKLEMDFVVRHTENSTHILNAVSPAFTCSLPFARYVVDEMKKRKIL